MRESAAVHRRRTALSQRTWILAVLAVAVVNVGAGIGTSSLYLDEAFTWRAATAPAGEILDRVRADEVAPPTYYVALRAWTELTGSEGEGALRIPSALAALVLVGAVMWCALALGGPRAALAAGAFAALSPLVLEYGQQARAYVFAAAACAIAFGALVRVGDGPGDGRRLALSAAASVAALWLHYTAALVVVVVLVGIALCPAPVRARVIAATAVAVGGLALLPLASEQLGAGHAEGVAPQARLTLENLVEVLGAPFYGRTEDVVPVVVLGALACLAACLVAARDRRTRLLAAAALTAPAGVALATLVGSDVVISRYVVVSAPFALVALGVAIARLSPPAALAAAGVVAALLAVQSVRAHLPEGRYAPYGEAFAALEEEWTAGDALVVDNLAYLGPLVEYYGRRLPSLVAVGRENAAAGEQLRAHRGRVWLLTGGDAPDAAVDASARIVGLERRTSRRWATRDRLGLFLLTRPE
jgi:mannosyltransferase